MKGPTIRRIPLPGRLLLSAFVAGTLALPGALPDATPQADARPGRGGLIVFSSSRVTRDNPEGDSEIFTMLPNGRGVKQLTRNDAADVRPAWSPDGQQIAFASNRDGVADEDGDLTLELYVMRANGSGQARITENADFEDSPDWSPDGQQIVFESDRDEDASLGSSSLYVMRADGALPTRITTAPAGSYDSDPAWSPDGEWIAFRRNEPRETPELADFSDEIYVVQPNGAGLSNLTNDSAHDEAPAWSPDGERIAFFSSRDDAENGDLFVMDADGANVTRLTNHPEFEYNPSWSPDGGRITFDRYDATGENSNLFVMRADGADVRQITDDPADEGNPDWGKKKGQRDHKGKRDKAGGKHHGKKSHGGSQRGRHH
jgi:TolB protein